MHAMVESIINAGNNFTFDMAITRKPNHAPQFPTKEQLEHHMTKPELSFHRILCYAHVIHIHIFAHKPSFYDSQDYDLTLCVALKRKEIQPFLLSLI